MARRQRTSSQKRHCWECRRRCLVCDSAQPSCRRCASSGVPCPGYGDEKPVRLTWLAPGNVVSRRRRSRTASASPSRASPPATTSDDDEAALVTPQVIIPRFTMRTDVCGTVEATHYFNSCIYTGLMPIQALGENPHVYPITPRHLQLASRSPDYLQFGMVCMTLGHRISQTYGEAPTKLLAERFYQYWDLAVASLQASLSRQNQEADDMIFAGIMTLMLADIQQGTALNWRCHLDGIQRLVMLRGGHGALTGSSSLKPILHAFWFIAVIGNTTCPSADLTMTKAHLETTDLILQQYGREATPLMLCPLPLFTEIIKINHIRARASHAPDGMLLLTLEADDILKRIERFSPQEWSASRASSQHGWDLIGQAYQAAVTIYHTRSLHSAGVLPTTATDNCADQALILKSVLQEGLPYAPINRFLVWPLVVLGFEAAYCDAAMRGFVSAQLTQMIRQAGTLVPLTAKRVLERFWAGGQGSGWDGCFDRPYAFTTQIAVDTRLLVLGGGVVKKK